MRDQIHTRSIDAAIACSLLFCRKTLRMLKANQTRQTILSRQTCSQCIREAHRCVMRVAYAGMKMKAKTESEIEIISNENRCLRRKKKAA